MADEVALIPDFPAKLSKTAFQYCQWTDKSGELDQRSPDYGCEMDLDEPRLSPYEHAPPQHNK